MTDFTNLFERANEARRKNRAIGLVVSSIVVGVWVGIGWDGIAAGYALLYLGALTLGY